jgi:hypothetical protein
MTLSDRNPLVLWAYLFEDHPYWEDTNLCMLFWRCVLFTPLKICFFGLMGLMLSLAIVGMIYTGWWVVVERLLIFVAAVGAIGGLIWVITSRPVKRAAGTALGTVVGPPVRAVVYVKQNYCPRIEIRGTRGT